MSCAFTIATTSQDWKLLEGGASSLGLSFPHVMGFDVAGTVAAVGSKCARLKVGDEVVSSGGSKCTARGSRSSHSSCAFARVAPTLAVGRPGEAVASARGATAGCLR